MRRSQLPPGPRGRIVPALQAIAEPFESLERWVSRYGDPFTVASPNGIMVMTGEPESLKRIFGADPDTFEVFSPGVLTPVLGERSLLLLAGAAHRRERRLLMPAFHGARMRAYGEAMAAISRRAIEREGVGRPFVMQRLTQAVSLEVIIQTVFGVDDPARYGEYAAATIEVMESVHPSFLFFPALRREFGGHGPFAGMQRAQRRFSALLDQQVERARPEAERRSDILSMLLAARYEDGAAMERESLVDELRTLLFAGHETTALALAWAFEWVHRTPAVLERLRAEIDGLGPDPSPEALAGLPYLEAVCNESLRISPLLTEVVRQLRVPFELGGYTIPAGVALAPSVILAHHRAQTFPEPGRFRPERFLERSYSPFEFMPFGGGTRRCLGAAFALFEMKIVLGTILGAVDLEPTSARPARPYRRNLSIAPRGGVPMVVRSRRDPRRAAA